MNISYKTGAFPFYHSLKTQLNMEEKVEAGITELIPL